MHRNAGRQSSVNGLVFAVYGKYSYRSFLFRQCKKSIRAVPTFPTNVVSPPLLRDRALKIYVA